MIRAFLRKDALVDVTVNVFVNTSMNAPVNAPAIRLKSIAALFPPLAMCKMKR